MTVEGTFSGQVVKTFGPSTKLSDDEYDKLHTLTQIFNLDVEELYLEWESFNVAEVQDDLELNMSNLIKFHEFLQKKLSNSRFTPNLKKTIKEVGSSVRKPLVTKNLNSGSYDSSPGTPQLKRRKMDYNSDNKASSPIKEHETSTTNNSNSNILNSSPIKQPRESHRLLETLNPHIEEMDGFGKKVEHNPIRITANFDPAKYKFRTMQMKLLESADVLDDQIDTMADLYQKHNQSLDLQFGNPCVSSQFDILCCGRIVPDSPSYDKETLNSSSLFLETSRLSGIGQRVGLDFSALSGYSFFPGQIVVLRGKNPTGKIFHVEEVMELPQLGTPVSTKDELAEVEDFQNNSGMKILVASGPYSNQNNLDFSKLENLVEKINTDIRPNVIILNGPFIDLTNKVVEDGDFSFGKDQHHYQQQQPRNLDEVFTQLITPILKKIDSKMQIILIPSLKDSCVSHCSYPQGPFDRRKFQIPKNVKTFPNPSSFALNEILIGSSNLDVFKDLKDVYKCNDDTISNNRFERIIQHVFDQRRYYPVVPGSVANTKPDNDAELRGGASGEFLSEVTTGGSSLEMPYLGLTELGDSLPDIIILPSELKVFAKVVKGVVVVNPGQFIRPSRSVDFDDGNYIVLSILPPNLNSETSTSILVNRYHATTSTTCMGTMAPLTQEQQNASLIADPHLPENQQLESLFDVKPRFELRDYQQNAVDKVLSALERGVRKPAVVVATGGGKTVIFANLIKHLKPMDCGSGYKVLVLVHTRELVEQAVLKIRAMNPGYQVGCELSPLQSQETDNVVVASVQTLRMTKRLMRFNPLEFKSIIIDECHHAPASSYLRILDHFGARKEESHISVIGFTATLARLDKRALGHVFDEIVYERSLVDMIQARELAHPKIHRAKVEEMNLQSVAKVRKDYDLRELYQRMGEIDFNETIVLSYMRLKENTQCRSTLIFCVNIEHCIDLCSKFHLQGIDAQYVTGNTAKFERAALIEDFKMGKIPILCNVAVFTEGTDIPNIDSIILARPTLSRTLSTQMIGRGLRLHEGKTCCHIVDLVGNTLEGIDVEATLEGEKISFKKKENLKEEEEVEMMIEEENEGGGILNDAHLSAKSRTQAIARILQLHNRKVLRLEEEDVFSIPDRVFRDTELVNQVMFKNRLPWIAISNGYTWGLFGKDDTYFLLKRFASTNVFKLYQCSHDDNSCKLLYEGRNLLEVLRKLEKDFKEHTVYAEKCNNFARKASPRQAVWLLSRMKPRIENYFKFKKPKMSFPEVHKYFIEVLSKERQAMVYSKMRLLSILTPFLVSGLVIAETITEVANEEVPKSFGNQSNHTNNWAVLVSTSRFWFNYRHMANALSFYRTVKRLGIPDSQIILMQADDIACNSRNAFPGTVFNNMDQALDLYGDSVEVDYRGYEVTVENFIRLLTDRWGPEQPRSKRLLTDENSNILIYLTGHGGNEFLKFQDAEEISAYDIADAFEQMHEKKRYNEIFFMIDTCQANTMYEKIYSPNILCVGSSRIDESSYSHHSDMDIGVAVIDRFTYYALDFLEKIDRNSKITMDKLFEVFTFENVHSNPGIRTDLFERDVHDVLLTDFFGNVQNVLVEENSADILSTIKNLSNRRKSQADS
ncbi:GPI8 [Candida oxycetoniae]|uniref:GPI8 n=1 Tax=Candida oxycetoniae TaxID=497107 RepID=A0AAI9WZ63_9ASCO|nr:GPI8 [Candida oxycetoniae]KAI3405858.2 GPI8 [Candida oxycetoniae]